MVYFLPEKYSEMQLIVELSRPYFILLLAVHIEVLTLEGFGPYPGVVVFVRWQASGCGLFSATRAVTWNARGRAGGGGNAGSEWYAHTVVNLFTIKQNSQVAVF